MSERAPRRLPGGRGVWVLAGIVALALAIRLASIPAVEYRLVYDAIDYDLHAQSIAATGGYPDDALTYSAPGPTAYRPPAYPYALAALYKLSGGRYLAAVVAQALLGALTAGLIGLVAWQLWGRGPGYAAASIAAVYPPFIALGNTLLSEGLFLFFEVAALAAVLRFRKLGQARWAALAGFCAGLAVLTRPNGLALLPMLCLGALVLRPPLSRRALAAPAMLLAAAAATICPWVVRNAVEMDAFVPLTTQSGYTMHGVYNDVSRSDPQRPGAWRPTTSYPRYRHLYRDSGEAEIDAKLRSEVLDYATAHPIYTAEAALRNAARMLELTGFEWGEISAEGIGLDADVGRAGTVSFWLLALLAACGAVLAVRRRTPPFLWLGPPLLLASVVFTVTDVRQRYPVDPFLILLAGLAVAAAFDRFRPDSGGAPRGD